MLIRGVGSYLSAYYTSVLGGYVVRAMRAQVFERILYLPPIELARQNSGRVVSRLTHDVGLATSLSVRALTTLVRDALTVVGLLAWMFYLQWILTLAVLSVAPAIYFLFRKAGKRVRAITRRMQDLTGLLTSDVEQTVSGSHVVRAYGGENYQRDRFEEVNREFLRQTKKLSRVKALNVPFAMLLAGAAFALIVYLFTFEAVSSRISIGSFSSFSMALIMIFRPMRALARLHLVMHGALAAADSVFTFIDQPIEKPEASAGRRLDTARGDIAFENVCFRYAPDAPDALSGVDLRIGARRTVALIGRSGAGKSTLVSLLLRLYEPASGRITIDGHDIRSLRLDRLRKLITYVGQGVILFRGTVAENIAYGRPATPADIREAARKAQALEFIERLPQGFDTPLGPGGAALSGGQAQRVCIARGILEDAPIAVFDEATSALDEESQGRILAALDALREQRSCIIVAHRFSTIEHADEVVVLDRGRVVQQGSHAELAAAGGVYAALRGEEERAMPARAPS